MDEELTGIFSQLSMPLSGLIETGAGFCIGGPDFSFVLTDRLVFHPVVPCCRIGGHWQDSTPLPRKQPEVLTSISGKLIPCSPHIRDTSQKLPEPARPPARG